MSLRAIVVAEDSEDRAMITKVISDLGHQVEEIAGPDFCLAYQGQRDTCPLSEPCHDIQIVNKRMTPEKSGLEFIRWQKHCGCKLREGNCAVISVDWPPDEVESADRLGVRLFTKPFLVKDLAISGYS